MSRAQGDGFKTWTDHKLNAYRARLDEKLQKLIDHHEKWFKCGDGWICAEEYNEMDNPNGSWKWNGWYVKEHVYKISVFPAECVEYNGAVKVTGWAQDVQSFTDREAAGRYFKTAQKLARNLKTWHPHDNGGDPWLYKAFDYEGRKPVARIALNWDGDTYVYSL